MNFTFVGITVATFLMFCSTFEYTLMDTEEGFLWFTPSYFMRKGHGDFIAWLFTIILAIVSPFWAALKILRWLFILNLGGM